MGAIDDLILFFAAAIIWHGLIPALTVLGIVAVVAGVRAHGRTRAADRHDYEEAA